MDYSGRFNVTYRIIIFSIGILKLEIEALLKEYKPDIVSTGKKFRM